MKSPNVGQAMFRLCHDDQPPSGTAEVDADSRWSPSISARDWKAATGQVLATAASVCQGSVDQVRALGFEVRTHNPVGALPAPTGLTVTPGKDLGEVVFAWNRGSARHGFIVQHATDVANPATFSGNLPCTRLKYTLKGAPPSSTVHFRVAAIDPSSETDLGPFSDWVAGVTR